MYNEIDQLPGWFGFVNSIADIGKGGGVIIVDTGSTDGTIEYAREQGATVIVDDIIKREGYGPARNHLRAMAKENFPNGAWTICLDADERIIESDFHRLRVIKDYLIDDYDVVALPRIDWIDDEMTKAAKDVNVSPDFQARMVRYDSPMSYVRRLHEQLMNVKQMYAMPTNPKINHFHRTAGKEKRDYVGKICAYLHMKDDEWGHTYPMHHKEQFYRELIKTEGL
jgi:glycosyltransferase involved in cell wall biosynthesis